MKKIFFLITLLLISFTSCLESTDKKNESSQKDQGITGTSVVTQFDSKYIKTQKIESIFYNHKIWSSENEDLNGDGTDDNIIVYSNNDYFSKIEEPKQYNLKICINNICYDQIVYFSANSYYGKETKFSIIDINKKDKYKELLLSYKESTTEDPSFNNSIFRYLSNNIVTVSEIFSSGYSNGMIIHL